MVLTVTVRLFNKKLNRKCLIAMKRMSRMLLILVLAILSVMQIRLVNAQVSSTPFKYTFIGNSQSGDSAFYFVDPNSPQAGLTLFPVAIPAGFKLDSTRIPQASPDGR